MPATPSEIIADIQELYLSDSIPWILGYSGGKDSTASLQLIWKAIAALPEDRRKFKPIHVISTDTLVENPVIAAWVELSLLQMNNASREQGLAIEAHRLTPALKDRFWVNLIGKGYPAPRPKFRWCTDRLKISASTTFIKNLSEANGEAILVLGVRRGESAVRDKVIEEYKGSTRSKLSRNADPKLSRVWIYMPIETWSSDDVWEYIITEPNPWGISNQELFDIYRGATPDAECPIVVDKSTPSCGDSRFGCYVCTMVTQDKSMAAMIQNDETKAWMQPIMSFRDNFLAGYDRHHRDFRRMDNRLILLRDQLVHGPYTQERRAELLKELLLTQEKVKEAGKEHGFDRIDLIPLEEIEEIRRIWVEQKGEIEDLIPTIYKSATGREYPGAQLDPMPLEAEDLSLLQTVIEEWISTEIPSEDPQLKSERRAELYKLLRTLLATSFKGLQSRNRSKQLDELGSLLKAFAFTDESDALNFAKQHLPASPASEENEEVDVDPQSSEANIAPEASLDGSTSKVIPIMPAANLLV